MSFPKGICFFAYTHTAESSWKPMRRFILLAALLATAPSARAQGCAQCRDNTAATPPRTQAAYRHAIELLAATAATLFACTVLLLRRSR